MSLFRVEALAGHDRGAFVCGDAELDRYFHEMIGQDVRRRVAAAYVAVGEGGEVSGFYTLSAMSIRLDAIPPDAARRLARYPIVPCALIGRLAVASRLQGRGLGGALLADAASRAMASGMGVFALATRPKNEAARRFYGRHGFMELIGEAELFLPIETARKAMG